jgi:hypothetical protein
MSSQDEVTFSFVGRKGPSESPTTAIAPFRVGPPDKVFLNNHYCWPLVPGAAAPYNTTALVNGSSSSSRGSSSSGEDVKKVQAVPAVQEEQQPRDLMVEYLPIEHVEEPDQGDALFARSFTQFYFK